MIQKKTVVLSEVNKHCPMPQH